jgi:error-prone DNA polymerase
MVFLPEARMLPDYAELHCLSNYSFLRGASHAEELVQRAHALGYQALAITDECSLAGVVRAWAAHRALPPGSQLQLIIGSELRLACGLKLVLLARSRAGYANLSALITLGRRRAEKGSYSLSRGDLSGFPPIEAVPDCLALWLPDAQLAQEALCEQAQWVAQRFAGRAWIAAELLCGADDAQWIERLQGLARHAGLPLVASGDVHMHLRARRSLQDVLTALRHNCSVFEAGHALFPNAERHLRTRLRLARLYPPDWLAATLTVAQQCQFRLDELRYEYPDEVVPPGYTAASFLRQEVEAGLRRRYPAELPAAVRQTLEHELQLISALNFEAYFLTVYDIVCFARSQGILCQGRGSAANSAVCYALGITEVDPSRSALLFERFISKERGEPPDIDVDFEHERREEVIQYLYLKYGRGRAALAAALITYRTRSALRDAGRAMGFGRAQIDAITKSLAWWDSREQMSERFAQAGLQPDSPRVQKWLQIAESLNGFPRHLSQHVGGFVISRGPLSHLVPIENAAMPERSVIQWDKDDLEALGLLKVDVLALGMLSAIRRTLALVSAKRGQPMRMQDIPPEDPQTYAMISAADTVGVFQIESRAQMSMLPRLRPQNFYDLVIEVALVRPGPIQGDMVHPYLRRRQGLEAVRYPSEAVEGVLSRTLGVPIFQEQVMQLAVVAAGFTPGEADALRRAMASWRHKGKLEQFQQKLVQGMLDNGYELAFAQALCRQIEGFGEYGFPESHAASFALLVYASAWLKRHEPAAFLAGMLNSLPMGFYSASQLIQDARRHGVDVRPVDVRYSAAASTLEQGAVRLGLHCVKGLSPAMAERLVEAREQGAWRDLADLARRATVSRRDLDLLAAADALKGLAGHRHQAAWQAAVASAQADLFAALPLAEAPALLDAPSESEDLRADYASMALSLGRHPLALLRTRLQAQRFVDAQTLRGSADRSLLRVAGLVTGRQRPGTASGVIFVTLEDEFGMVNVVVHAPLAERQRRELLASSLLGVFGQVQREAEVVHLIAKRLVDLSSWLGELALKSRDFH